MPRKPREDTEPDALVSHDVRERWVCEPRGESKPTLSVYCELQEHSVPVEHCGRCARFGRVMSEGKALTMVCTPGERSRLQHATVRDAMARQVHCLREGITCQEALSYLHEHELSVAPVVDENARLVGLARTRDLRAAPEHAPLDLVVVRQAAHIGEDDELGRAAARLAYEELDLLTVIDGSGTVIGALRPLDVVAWWARSQGFVLQRPRPA